MKKMMFLSKNWYFSVQKALIYYTVNKSHHNSFILLVLSHVANFRYVAHFRFLTLSDFSVAFYVVSQSDDRVVYRVPGKPRFCCGRNKYKPLVTLRKPVVENVSILLMYMADIWPMNNHKYS